MCVSFSLSPSLSLSLVCVCGCVCVCVCVCDLCVSELFTLPTKCLAGRMPYLSVSINGWTSVVEIDRDRERELWRLQAHFCYLIVDFSKLGHGVKWEEDCRVMAISKELARIRTAWIMECVCGCARSRVCVCLCMCVCLRETELGCGGLSQNDRD